VVTTKTGRLIIFALTLSMQVKIVET